MCDLWKDLCQEAPAGETIFENERALNNYERPFPNHGNDRSKGLVLTVSNFDRDTGSDVPIQPKSKPDFDKMAQWLHGLLKLKKCKMDFSLEQNNNQDHH